MQHFKIETLVDITQTNQFRHQPGELLSKNQQQNFAMMIQTIALRANPIFDTAPCAEIKDLKNMYFGSVYTGNHRVWVFNFSIEYDGAFADAQARPMGLLEQDLHFVPVIDELTETIKYALAVFNTDSTEYRNTVVYTVLDK